MILLKYKDYITRINPKGAEVKSFSFKNYEYIWNSDPAFWGKSFPLLFPAIGFLKDGKTLINGSEYSIPKHGFLRDSVFKTVQNSESEALFKFDSNVDTLTMFPFEFSVEILYKLDDNGFTAEYRIKNRDSKSIPFCFGLHPAFMCPISKPSDFEKYSIVFEKEETLNSPLIDPKTGVINTKLRKKVMEKEKILSLNYELFKDDALIFESINSKSVTLKGPDFALDISFSPFTSLGLWTVKDAPFICIEPWCGMNDRIGENGIFEEKFGCEHLNSGQEKIFTLSLSPSEVF